MTKFKALLFKFLPNAAHYHFCSQVSKALAAAGEAVLTALGGIPARFNAWLDKEFALMEWIKRNLLTERIAEVDHRMDQALVGLNAQAHAQEYSPMPDRAEAAHEIRIMLRNYGKVYSKPYEEQEGDVQAILTQLHGEYSHHVMVLDLFPFVDKLQMSFDEFQQLLAQRDTKSLQKPDETFPVVRRGLETEYHQLVTLVDAGATLNASPDFAAFINALNPEIERLNSEFHRARKDLSIADHCVIEPIGTQAYNSGKSVTPLPRAYYCEDGKPTKELAFAKDFSVTYKNNLKVGMAELTIHGKGHYKGQKTATFNIAHIAQ
jgi:hypothetical protein